MAASRGNHRPRDVVDRDRRHADIVLPATSPLERDDIGASSLDRFMVAMRRMAPREWLGSPLAARFPLHLLTTQPATRLHGQIDMGTVSQQSKVAGREPMRINPADAAARGIGEGDVVRVFNDRGAILVGAVLTDAIRQGVIQIATGAWYDPETPGEIGSLDKHGNPNVLTPDRGTSKLAQGPSAHSTLVEVKRFEGSAPPVSAFDSPIVA